MRDEIIMEGVREYGEESRVELCVTDGAYQPNRVPREEWPGHGRLVIRAYNEGGNNCTEVDLLDLLQWLRENRPEVLGQTSAN